MLSKVDKLRSMTTVKEQDKTALFLSYDINNTEARQDKLEFQSSPVRKSMNREEFPPFVLWSSHHFFVEAQWFNQAIQILEWTERRC
jgi:hypothetical protein